MERCIRSGFLREAGPPGVSWRKGLTVGTRPCAMWGPVKEPLCKALASVWWDGRWEASSMRTGEEEGQTGAHVHPPLPPKPGTSWGSCVPHSCMPLPQRRPCRSCRPSAGPMPTRRASRSAPVCAVCALACRVHGSGCPSAQLPGAARLLLWPASPRAIQEREFWEM